MFQKATKYIGVHLDRTRELHTTHEEVAAKVRPYRVAWGKKPPWGKKPLLDIHKSKLDRKAYITIV